jgi:transposase
VLSSLKVNPSSGHDCNETVLHGDTSEFFPPFQYFCPPAVVNIGRRHVTAASKLHDDTQVPMLAPDNGKTKTDHPWTTAAAAWFAYTADRKGEVQPAHLSNFTGRLQADGYAGFNQIYEAGRIQGAAWQAHARRMVYDLHAAHESPVAVEAIELIGALYEIEQENGDACPRSDASSVRRERGRCRNR